MKVLISGASIAGPALAHFLRRHDVTIVERATELRRGGYAVDVRGTALRVIEEMNLRDRIRALETDTLYNECVDARGNRFGRTKRGFGVIDPGDIEILRGDLAHLLHAITRDDVDYRFGDHVLAIDGHDVAFASGRCDRYDLIVGADGVHSRTRELVFGTGHVAPMGSAMAIFSAPNFLGLDHGQLLFSALRRIASIKAVGSGLLISAFYPAADFDPGDVPAQRGHLIQAFADQGWEWPRLLDAARTAPDFYADVTCQVRGDIVRDHVALVGDAGYCPSPLSGQGTSLALVGARILATEIESGAPLPAALARYQQRMLPFARRNQDIALKLAKGFAPTTTFQLRMRNLFMRLMPYMPWAPLVMKLAMRDIRRAALAAA